MIILGQSFWRPLVLWKTMPESSTLLGLRPRAICAHVVARFTTGLFASLPVCVWKPFFFFYSVPSSTLIHHGLTGHVDRSCCGSQVTMAPAYDTSGCGWLVYCVAPCQVIFKIGLTGWHHAISNSPSERIHSPNKAKPNASVSSHIHLCQG